MLLFFPVARSTFLHWMLGTSFPALIKYHRCPVLTSHWILIWIEVAWEAPSELKHTSHRQLESRCSLRRPHAVFTMHASASALRVGHQLPGPHKALQMYQLRPESLTLSWSTLEGEFFRE